MGTVIRKQPNSHGTYRYIRNVDETVYPTSDWLRNPDVSGLANVPEIYWKVEGSPETVVEMSMTEKEGVNSKAQDQGNIMIAGMFAFEKPGVCRNRWLGFGVSKSSNTIPYVVPAPIKVTALTFTNQKDGVDADIAIYKNNSELYVWEIRNKRFAWRNEGLHALTFEPGDYIGVYVKDQGDDPKNIIVTLHYTSFTHKVGEGGSSTL